MKVGSLVVEKAFITCILCARDFWFIYKNKSQNCPHCGAKNWREGILKRLV